jgi:hypothetical protein
MVRFKILLEGDTAARRRECVADALKVCRLRLEAEIVEFLKELA